MWEKVGVSEENPRARLGDHRNLSHTVPDWATNRNLSHTALADDEDQISDAEHVCTSYWKILRLAEVSLYLC